MKFAKLETSARLQRVLALLSDAQPHSTRDIMLNAHVCAVNSCIAELRENGIDISCSQRFNPDTKQRIFIYQLREAA